MKTMKKLASILLAVVLLMAMSVPAFAGQGSGTITVKNATIGQDYAAYKLFDATYAGTNVSYTIAGDSQWYTEVEDSDLFVLTEISPAGSGVYNVVYKTTTTEAMVLTWMKSLTTTGMTADFETTAASTTVKWESVPYGYYLVTSSVGDGAVTVTSNLPNATIIDKNQAPGFGPEDPENPDNSSNKGKFIKDGKDAAGEDVWVKANTASINDTVDFKINAFTPAYSGSAMVVDYTFTDTLAKGLTFNADLAVKVMGNFSAPDAEGKMIAGTTLTLTQGTDYKLTTTPNQDGTTTFEVVINALSIANYPTDAYVSITYSADVNEDAVFTNVNSVTMDWRVTNPNNPWDPTDPENPDKGTPVDPENYEPEDPDFPNPLPPTDPSITKTYVYGFNLQKYEKEAKAGNELNGAKFKIYDAETGGNEIKVVKDGDVYRVALDTETGVDIEAGFAQIFGLKAGTYYLEETVAPDGFNMLTARQAVTLADERANDAYTGKADVINLSGATLPSTGGIGTTIFYVMGGVLVLGAVVLLITKKRMSNTAKSIVD